MNLFLTEDGVLKLGYYGLTTQAECYSIRKNDCNGVRSFAFEVFKGEYEMGSDLWSLGITLIEMMGIAPYYWCNNDYLPTRDGDFESPFDVDDIESEELVHFLKECWSVNELLNVSVMGWRMMSRIHL